MQQHPGLEAACWLLVIVSNPLLRWQDSSLQPTTNISPLSNDRKSRKGILNWCSFREITVPKSSVDRYLDTCLRWLSETYTGRHRECIVLQKKASICSKRDNKAVIRNQNKERPNGRLCMRPKSSGPGGSTNNYTHVGWVLETESKSRKLGSV